MNDANTSSTAFPAPLSHLQHLLIFGLENWAEPQNKAEPGRDRTRDGDEERLARARENRERESDGVLGRARQLRLPTMAAQGGLHLRVSSRREKRQVERESERAERYWALRFAELRPDARREKERNRKRLIDRRTDHCLLNVLTSYFLLCVSQRG